MGLTGAKTGFYTPKFYLYDLSEPKIKDYNILYKTNFKTCDTITIQLIYDEAVALNDSDNTWLTLKGLNNAKAKYGGGRGDRLYILNIKYLKVIRLKKEMNLL